MRYGCLLVLLTAGIASPQSIPQDLVTYLNLTSDQTQAINKLDQAFTTYTNKQSNAWSSLQLQAQTELAKASPDASAVGDVYAQMEMIRRDYNTQLGQVQSNVAAVLNPDQITQVSALLNVERLQPLVTEARCISMETQQVVAYSGIFDPATSTNVFVLGFLSTTPCTPMPLPEGLVTYFNLTDAQIFTIQSAIQANQDYTSRQSTTIQELQYQIQDLTAAQTIDPLALGAAYVQIAQIQNDEKTQSHQLTTTVRSVLTDQQQPLLQALDNAAKLEYTATEAVAANILVLPPDLTRPCSLPYFAVPPFTSPVCVSGSFSTAITANPRYTGHGTK